MYSIVTRRQQLKKLSNILKQHNAYAQCPHHTMSHDCTEMYWYWNISVVCSQCLQRKVPVATPPHFPACRCTLAPAFEVLSRWTIEALRCERKHWQIFRLLGYWRLWKITLELSSNNLLYNGINSIIIQTLCVNASVASPVNVYPLFGWVFPLRSSPPNFTAVQPVGM